MDEYSRGLRGYIGNVVDGENRAWVRIPFRPPERRKEKMKLPNGRTLL